MQLAYDDDGTVVGTEQFDFDAVARDLGEEEPLESVPDADRRALQLQEIVLGWIWQNGKNNIEGIAIRAIIACWIFQPELRHMHLSELARGFGKHKQSFGRWHDDFKRAFPLLRTIHMR